MDKTCPVCGSKNLVPIHHGENRNYFNCGICKFVFVPPEYHLSPEAEKAHYDTHENDPNDEGYRKFLSALFNPLNQKLSPNSRGLDFGSGPGPTLSLMFEEAGHEMEVFDKFYAQDKSPMDQRYDFVTATEVVEHLDRPMEELDRLWGLIKPGGFFGLMTQFNDGLTEFANWYYKLDPTHIGFFAPETFEFIQKKWGAEMILLPPNTVIFKKLI